MGAGERPALPPKMDTHKLCSWIRIKSPFKARRLMAPPADRHTAMELQASCTPTRRASPEKLATSLQATEASCPQACLLSPSPHLTREEKDPQHPPPPGGALSQPL